jgi:hypothetical protein
MQALDQKKMLVTAARRILEGIQQSNIHHPQVLSLDDRELI